MTEVFVAKAAELPDGERRIVSHAGVEIGVFHWQGAYYAYQNLCVHQGGPACEGVIMHKVEDVLDLGDAVEVRVDDVDPNGKVSLSLASSPVADEAESGETAAVAAPAQSAPAASDATESTEREYVSFEDAFDAEISSELGDLGPAGENRGGDRRNGGRRGGNRRR